MKKVHYRHQIKIIYSMKIRFHQIYNEHYIYKCNQKVQKNTTKVPIKLTEVSISITYMR